MKHYKHFINGIWTNPSSNKWFDTENPYTVKFGRKYHKVIQKMLIKLFYLQKMLMKMFGEI